MKPRTSFPKRKRPLPRGKKPIPKRNPKRKAKEFARAYGSDERVEFVKSLPCIVATRVFCGVTKACCAGDIENAHTKGGGMGRKAPASSVVPMCSGHHRYLHTVGSTEFQAVYRVDLTAEAAKCEAAWLAYVTARAA